MSTLNRQIGILSGTTIAISMVIGSGLLGLPGVVIDEVGPQVALYGWFAIVLFMLPMLFVFTKLGLLFPKVGGLSYYAEIALGPWAKSSVVVVLVGTFFLGIPALALIGAAYAAKAFNLSGGLYVGIIAAGFLLMSVAINISGVTVTSAVNSISIFFVLAVVAMVALGNITFISKGFSSLAYGDHSTFSFKSLWSAFSLIFWAFLGWENLSFGLEEFKNPRRTIPIVYVMSFAIVLVLYWVLALAASGASLSGMSVSGAAGLSVLFPPSVQFIMVGLVAIVILANANSWVFGCSRLVYSGGEGGILPSFLGKLDSRQIPRNSLVFMGLVFTIIISIMTLLEIPVSVIVKLVSQNFVVLFGVSIIAFYKSSAKNVLTLILTCLATCSCLFLISGFTIWITYPVALMTIGYFRYRQISVTPKPVKC